MGNGKQPVDIRKNGTGEVLYKAYCTRDTSVYPLTDAGKTKLEKDASKGLLNLTGTCPDGTIFNLPVGTRPPLSPPCSGSTSVSVSTIGLAARYSYSLEHGGALQIRAMGETGKEYRMKIVPKTGTFTLSNPDNQTPGSLQQNTNYPPGPVSAQDGYTLDWSLWGVTSNVEITLTFTRLSDNVTFSKTFTPKQTTSALQLFTAASSNNTNPNPNPNPNPPVGPGSISGGYAEGTLAQLLALSPFVPSNNQLSSWPLGNTTQYLYSTSGYEFGLLKSVGAAISHLATPGGKNWINTFDDGNNVQYEGAHAPNRGRSGGPSTYGGPHGANQKPFNAQGQSTSRFPGDDDTGWNPVVAGDKFNNSPEMQWFERKTVIINGVSREVMYARSQPMQWSLNNVKAEQINHMFYYWDGPQSLRYVYIIEIIRTDNQQEYRGRQNELPYLYLTADLYRYPIYDGDSPGTFGPLKQIQKPQPVEGNTQANQNDTGDYVSTENWIAGINNSDQGVFLIPDYCSQVGGKQFQSWTGDQYSNASAYINSKVQTNFDVNLCSLWTGRIWVGGLSDFRQWLSNNPASLMPFSFTFGTGKTAGWYSEDASSLFNGDNRYQFIIGEKNQDGSPGGAFCSPWGSWKASDISTIYIKGKFSPGVNAINLQWNKPNQDAITIEQYNNKQVSIIGDGQEHTYAVPMSGTGGWSGIIARLRIKLPRSSSGAYPSMAGNEVFIPSYIGTTNPG